MGDFRGVVLGLSGGQGPWNERLGENLRVLRSGSLGWLEIYCECVLSRSAVMAVWL